MLTKDMILEKLEYLELSRDDYIVITGSALVLHGVKDTTRDIDLITSSDILRKLVTEGYPSGLLEDGEIYVSLCDKVDVFDGVKVNDVCTIDGFNVSSLSDIKSYKLLLGRVKDIEDIRLIEEFENLKRMGNKK